VERVLANARYLSPRGLAALHDAGAEADVPTLAFQADGSWKLDFLSVVYRPQIVDGGFGGFGVDLRSWTVRRLAGDGVEWQSRPLAVDVPGALSPTV
jgi:hypothetical protein